MKLEEKQVKKKFRAGYVADILEKEERRLRDHEKMAVSRELDRKAYEDGQKWFDSGLGLEDAPEELKNNRSFVYGFERGQRLASIPVLEERIKSSRK